MYTYVVSYDLSAPGRDYERLFSYLKTYPYAHIVESTWVIKTYKSASEIRDEIARYIDSNDKLLVVQTTRNSAWLGLGTTIGNWLNQHLVAA